MIEDKELWTICLGLTAFILTMIKALIIASNPHLNGSPSNWNTYQASEKIIIRFAYDFISSFFNIMYLLFIVTPISLIVYWVCRFF